MAFTSMSRSHPHIRNVMRRIFDEIGVPLRTDVFETKEAWEKYALDSLKTVHRVAHELGLKDKLHLWPDRSLGTPRVIRRMPKKTEYSQWLNRCWARVSEWPKAA